MQKKRPGTFLIGMLLGLGLGTGLTFAWMKQFPIEHSSAHDGEGHDDEKRPHETGEHRTIELSPTAIQEARIETAEAKGGLLEETLVLPGEITYNADKIAHIVSRVAGIVRSVHKHLGDDVQPGDILAVLESRELAEAKAAHLAARQRFSLAQAICTSAQELNTKRIMSDLDFLATKKALTESEIELKTTQNRLHALGLSKDETDALSPEQEILSLYELRAPFSGTIVQKHITPGEVVDAATDTFLLADLSTVWADITVYSQDVERVFVGQKVEVRLEGSEGSHRGEISYVSAEVDEATRTATARIVVPNEKRCCKPGAFLTASLVTRAESVHLLVPLDAVQEIENRSIVFIDEGHGFEPRPVVVGRKTETHAQILSGLEPGTLYVTQGAFILKSELGKGEAGHEH